jgi:hypothetical protein
MPARADTDEPLPDPLEPLLLLLVVSRSSRWWLLAAVEVFGDEHEAQGAEEGARASGKGCGMVAGATVRLRACRRARLPGSL